jgi:hypothetical protein
MREGTTVNLFKDVGTLQAWRARLENAYHWSREWVGEFDDLVLALAVYALAGIWLIYSI